MIHRIYLKSILMILLIMISLNQNIAEGVPGTSSVFFIQLANKTNSAVNSKRYQNLTLKEWREKFKNIDPLQSESDQYIPGLILIVKDSHAPLNARSQASYLLARMGKRAKRVVPLLIQLVQQEKKNETLFWILKSFELLGKEAVQAGGVVRSIVISEKSDLSLRQAALGALIKIGPEYPQTIPTLVQLLIAPSAKRTNGSQITEKNSGKISLAIQSAQGLSNMGEKASPAFPFLLRLAEHPDELLRMECVNAIGSMSSQAEPALPLLLSLISTDRSFAVRDAARKALGKIGPLSIPGLMSLLDSSSGETKKQSLGAIKLTGTNSQTVYKKLLGMLNDVEADVRVEVASVIWVLYQDANSILPLLIKEVSNRNRDVRSATVRLLIGMGKSAFVALPQLKLLLNDSEAYVRVAARKAVDGIEQSAKK